MKRIRFFIVFVFVFMSKINAQQDPHYTQYMYNTMSINPAYAGSRDHAFISALARTQWLGLEGAPNTQSLNFDSPIGRGVGMGVNIINDVIGPSKEISVNTNWTYTIDVSQDSKLAFGVRFGARVLSIDWSQGTYYHETDPIYKMNFYKALPTLGTGIYYYAPQKWYVGLSVPNFLRSESYNQELSKSRVQFAMDKLHAYVIAGYVFSISDDIKFKPATLIKIASGAPLSVDVSANFYYNRFNAGLAYRSNDSLSALLGFRITDSLSIGYAYDLTTSNYRISNRGTHEVVLQFQFFDITGPKRLGCFF